MNNNGILKHTAFRILSTADEINAKNEVRNSVKDCRLFRTTFATAPN
jgi:hypothetical protein